MDEYREVEHLGIRFKVNRYGDVYTWMRSRNCWDKAKLSYDDCGYLRVAGYNPKIQQTRNIGVHILVAKAFVPNPENLDEVNHKDFNRANPRWDNLEWISHGDNVRYSRDAGRYPSQVGELNSNYGNRTLSKKYAEDKELALEKQSRPMGQNGRARKCKLYKLPNEFIGEFSCQREAVYFLFDNELLKRVKMPEGTIKWLKREQGYKGYKLVLE